MVAEGAHQLLLMPLCLKAIRPCALLIRQISSIRNGARGREVGRRGTTEPPAVELIAIMKAPDWYRNTAGKAGLRPPPPSVIGGALGPAAGGG